MTKLICENPPIERTADNSRILGALERHSRFVKKHENRIIEPLAKNLGGGIFVVNWHVVLKEFHIRLIGKKYWEKIREWANQATPTGKINELENAEDIIVYILVQNRKTNQEVKIEGNLELLRVILKS